MTCTNCALTINKFLEKEGMKNVKVNPVTGEVMFDNTEGPGIDKIEKGIESLGYPVAEKNGVIEKFKTFGIKSKNAFQTQSLIQLKNEYCNKSKCLGCAIGMNLLHKK